MQANGIISTTLARSIVHSGKSRRHQVNAAREGHREGPRACGFEARTLLPKPRGRQSAGSRSPRLAQPQEGAGSTSTTSLSTSALTPREMRGSRRAGPSTRRRDWGLRRPTSRRSGTLDAYGSRAGCGDARRRPAAPTALKFAEGSLTSPFTGGARRLRVPDQLQRNQNARRRLTGCS